jgi:hypothetical protein
MKELYNAEKELSKALDEIITLKFNRVISLRYIDEQLEVVERMLKSKSLDLVKIRKEIPDDPSIGKDIFKDGVKNENPYLKSDMLENYQHQIGYFNGCKQTLLTIKHLLTVEKEQYNKEKEEEKKTSIENEKRFQDVIDKINAKIKKL